MHAPTAAELLGAWERSAALGPAEREDAFLRLTQPDEDPAGLPVGERDARLLELRELLFGGRLDGAAECPRCGEPVEYSASARTLRTERPQAANGDGHGLNAFGYELRFRLPTGGDLAEAAAAHDLEGARELLLERCVLSATADGREEAPAGLPPLWSEVESWAWRTLFDVHVLASAYGWSEAAVLALGPRRDLYLELVKG